MGFHTGKHGKVYNDSKSIKGSGSDSPGNHDGSLKSGRDYFQSNDNLFGFTNEPDGLDTKAKRIAWKKACNKWNELHESERFDIIHEKFYNSNLPNINDLSEKDFDDLPEDIQLKLISRVNQA